MAETSPLEDIRLLLKVFEAEHRLGHRNNAVFGGFSRFAVNKLKSAIKKTKGEVPVLLKDVKERLYTYKSLSPSGRSKLIKDLAPLLHQVERKLDKPADILPILDKNKKPKKKKEPKTEKLDDDVINVKGVGTQSAETLKGLSILTRRDLLYHFPYRYEDRRQLIPIRALTIGATAAVMGTVNRMTVRRPGRGRKGVIEATISDGTGSVVVVFFNQPYLSRILKKGAMGVFFGKIGERFGRPQLVSPEFELVKPGEEQETIGRIVPFYRLCRGLSQKKVRRLIGDEVTRWADRLEEPLPLELVRKYSLMHLSDAMYNVHHPETMTDVESAKRRLVFEELFILQTVLAMKKHFFADELPGTSLTDEKGLIDKLRKSLPFSFTNAQERALQHILKDLAGPRSMSRLLQGEVGSGKTIVALSAIVATVGAGFQGAIMAPTEILAEQHYLTVRKICGFLDLKTELLVGAMGKKERREALARISSGEAQVVIGTHAVIQKDVVFKRLGLAVIDEQHRFGVAQRSNLRHKGLNPNLLVMTATPIPRTLCLTLYGDLDFSVLDEMPPGRLPVQTKWLRQRHIHKAYKHIEDEVAKGRQAFIVCPRIERSESIESIKEEARAAKDIYDELSGGQFSHRRLRLLHGRMKTAEKEEIMEAFRQGECDILVSTTVVEVGIDIPNASVMTILGAERFGLAQLHQLRGRVGRGKANSYCYLVSDAGTEEAEQRLQTLVSTNDGFKVAEVDLTMRGPGDFFGTRQSGLPDLHIANLVKDFRILEQTREEAFALIERDPSLTEPGHEALQELITTRFRKCIYFRS